MLLGLRFDGHDPSLKPQRLLWNQVDFGRGGERPNQSANR